MSVVLSKSFKQHPLFAFFESASDMMLLIDERGIIQRGNAALQFFLGKDLWLQIQDESIIQFFQHPSLQQESISLYLNQIATSRQLIYTTWKEDILPPNAVSLSVSQLPEIAGYLLIIRPLIVKEQSLNKSNLSAATEDNSLEKVVLPKADQTTDTAQVDVLKLQTLLKNTREFSRVKSKFISIASHEFRTPLSTILASADLIGRYAQQTNETRFEHHITRIKASVRNLTKILENFLSLDKLETGSEIYEPQSVDMVSFLQRIISEASTTLRAGQSIKLDLQSEQSHLHLDPRILQIILFNLLNNAAKYSAEGAVIHLTINKLPEQLYIIVKDDGIGIPKSDRPHIFTRFYRGQNTVNTNGAGLGLNVVEQYLQLVQGRIEFSSTIKQGTTFQVWLPTKE